MQQLRQALREQNGYKLLAVAQPIKPISEVDLPANHFELLVRIIQPDGSVLSPGDFLPVAELDPDLMIELDWWMIRQAAKQLNLTENEYSINFSHHLLEDHFLVSKLKKSFKGIDIKSRLIFEVSERYQTWRESEIVKLGNLRKIVRLSLDDMGEARLARLVQLPVSGFKIDGLLIRGVPHSDMETAIVMSLLWIAWKQDLICVCEWVYQAEILEWLQLQARLMPGINLYVQGEIVGDWIRLD